MLQRIGTQLITQVVRSNELDDVIATPAESDPELSTARPGYKPTFRPGLDMLAPPIGIGGDFLENLDSVQIDTADLDSVENSNFLLFDPVTSGSLQVVSDPVATSPDEK